MLGYFSGEWLFLAVAGLAAAAFGGKAVYRLNSVDSMWMVAVVIALAFYALLRLAGRTPIGITYKSHPAARGHPLLSVLASVAIFLILAFHILSTQAT